MLRINKEALDRVPLNILLFLLRKVFALGEITFFLEVFAFMLVSITRSEILIDASWNIKLLLRVDHRGNGPVDRLRKPIV